MAQRVGDAVKRVSKAVLGDEYAPVTEGVAFLMKREGRKKKNLSSQYLTQRDAGKVSKKSNG